MSAEVQRFQPRIFDPLEAALLSDLCGKRRSITFGFEGAKWNSVWLVLTEPLRRSFHLRLKIGGRSSLLHVALAAGSRLEKRFAENTLPDTFDEATRCAVTAALARELLDAWQTALNIPVELDPTQSDEALGSETYHLCFQTSDASGVEQCRGLLQFGAELAEEIHQRSASLPPSQSPVAAKIRAIGTILAGAVQLDSSTVANLQPLSLIFLNEDPRANSTLEIAVTGIQNVRGKVPEANWHNLFSPLQKRVVIDSGTAVLMSDPNPTSGSTASMQGRTTAAPATAAQASAQILVEFSLGSRQFAWEELGQLHEGAIFNLDQPLDRIVTILANGTKIAEGELMQVGEKTAVLITRIETGA